MVGIILRFPLFCVGVFLWAVALMPLAVLFMFGQIVCIPFVFLSSAFSNDPKKLEDHIKDTFSFQESLGVLDDLKSWFIKT
jgi:hypothetical protein